MKLTITVLKLKSPFHFFSLANYARLILKQLKTSPSKDYKARGIWKTHYTMSLWENDQDLKQFATSGDHLKAMQKSAQIASEIVTYTIDSDKMLPWDEAKRLLYEKGKRISF